MKIVVLSGAGLSAESGIETFRAKDGLWANHSVDAVATVEGFNADPALVHKFYNERRMQLKEVEPNAAHYALAKLEKTPGIDLFHVTQNIDDLCERAGAKELIHMHGELLKCRCIACAEVMDWRRDTNIHTTCPECGFKSEWGGIRPHIVWFGEMPMRMNEIEKALQSCDLFVAIGTSGKVYPAARFVQIAKDAKAKTLLLNKDPAENSYLFDNSIIGNATEIVPKWVKSLA
ncbi:MAG: NAD-dependent deacylase [Victivallaceae bacterium]|nr:NAD-dependent deacylase [Victivallaceae bacterium]